MTPRILTHPEGEEWVDQRQAILFDHGDTLWLKAGAAGIRFVLLSGKPLREPIAWGGPVVMNTEQELRLAFEEYRNNTFIN